MRRLGVQTTKDAQPFSPITRRTRRSLRERQQSAIAPITCGTLTVKGGAAICWRIGRPIPSSNMPRPGQGDGRSCGN